MSHHQHQCFDLYCCLSNEFLITYPSQLQPSLYDQKKKNKIHRNTNASESTSSLRLTKYKPKNLLHPYKISKDHYRYDTQTSGGGGGGGVMTNKIMSIETPDDEVEFYMMKESTMSIQHQHLSQMADGDKKNENILENIFDDFEQHIINTKHKDLIRPVPCKPTFNDQLKQSSYLKSLKNPISHISSSQISQSILPLNRTSTWRKLQANITSSHYNHIQQFQQERLQKQQHPIMLAPFNKPHEIDDVEISKVISNTTNSCISSASLLINSPINSSDSRSSHRIIQSIDVDQQILGDDDDNSNVVIPVTNLRKTTYQPEIYPTENLEVKFPNHMIPNSLSISTNNDLKLQEIDNIEEFQPIIELSSPSHVPSILLNDILSSFFPTISTPLASTLSSNDNPLVFHSHHHHHTNNDISKTSYMLFDNTANMAEFLIIDQSSPLPSSFIEPNFISENHPSKKVHSLYESIEELCHLIRKLLQYELTEQKITSLQATIASQLAILLTYLAIPSNNEKINSQLRMKDTTERMTSTDENDFCVHPTLVSTIGTQTDDIKWTMELNDQLSKPVFDSSNNIHFHIEPLSSQKVTSQTELTSTSVSFHLPGHRPHHALSDTFIYHIHHHQQYSSSYHQLISYSETTIHSLIHNFHHQKSIKEQTQYLLKRIGQNFQHYIELESSNTCLEGSTEFTPDFLLTTINNSKYDGDDDDQTEQFGIDTERQDYQTDTISLIINDKYEKIDTLTFNSIGKENYDSLELDIEHDNEEYPLFVSTGIHQSINESNIAEDDMQKSSITEINSLFLNNTTSISLDDDHISPIVNQLLEPLLKTYQWQVPILPRKINNIDMIYEKRTAKIEFKYLKIRSNSNNGINIIGKRVRIKSNSSSRASTPTIQSYLSQEQSKKSLAVNYNNNYNEHTNSIQSWESSTSIDSLYSLDSDTLDKNSTDQCPILPENLRLLLINYPNSDELALRLCLPNKHETHDNLVKTTSLSSTISSHSLEIIDKLDSNIVFAESLLVTLDSINNNSNKSNIDLLHMYIRQFLIEFDARIRDDRKRKKSESNTLT